MPSRNGRPYTSRIVDSEIDALLGQLPAILIEGAKGMGKTATASQRAATIRRLDEPGTIEILRADPSRMLMGAPPILLDEWQRFPESWDRVRRAVDDGAAPGSFILTGSASPPKPETHSGAGRIVNVRMHPLSLAERAIATSSVSLSALLLGGRTPLSGSCSCTVETYAEEIVASGFPGLRGYSGSALGAQLDGYLARIVDRDIPDQFGRKVRKPEILKSWMAAYAAAVSTTADWETIRDAAAIGGSLTKDFALTYREILKRLWILDPVEPWLPTFNHLRRLGGVPKHQLADPALAVRLLGLGVDALLNPAKNGRRTPRDGTFLGALFESLVTQSVRVYAQAAGAGVFHLRMAGGEQEVDLIVKRPDGKVVALEIKLAQTVGDQDTRHLKWLQARIGDDLLDAVIISTGQEAYRRADGIAVVPAALLGA
jgi:predicted AAA+ superfamily ATPase